MAASGRAPITAAQIAAVVADPRIAEARPATLVAAVRPIAELKDAQKTEYQWTLSARAARPGLKWIVATFEPEKSAPPAPPAQPDGWKFVSLQIGIVAIGGEETALASALIKEITARLGKGRRERKSWVWRLAGARELYLMRGKETDPTSDPPVEVRVISLEVQPVASH